MSTVQATFDLNNEDERRAYTQSLHNRFNHSREQVDNSLVHVVLGTTLLIIGLLFLFLSNKMDPETYQKHITTSCAEFWVSMVGLVVGFGLLVAGLVRLFYQLFGIQKPVMRAIKSLQNGTYDNLPEAEKEKAASLSMVKKN